MTGRRFWSAVAWIIGLCAGRAASAQGCFAFGAPLFRDFTLAAPLFGDTLVRDTLRRDTSKTRPLVTWADSDSVIARLLVRPGYHAIRYQGDQVTFDAQRRNLRIVGVPAAVQRVQAIVVGDTIIYNDSTRVVVALGDTVILHDPAQQSSDVVARGRIVYNVGARRGVATNVSTSVTSGAQYYISGDLAFQGDTSRAKSSVFYVRNGIITSCDDSVPDYYFQAREIKYISKHLIVARPAVLYVAGVPVFWLPFLFQDIRSGRQSGLLTPRFGISEFVRTSSSYRRHFENLGYYANLGDYMDALGWIDWRSGAGAVTGDPGFTRLNGEFRYHWLDRFMTGRLAVNHLSQGDGSTNTAVSWFHNQDFSQTSHLTASVNYVTNTTAQSATLYSPAAVLATIRSDVRYSRTIGPFSLDVGGTRTQYPGRSQVDEGYPSVSVSSPTLALTRWLDWTPGFNYTRQATVNNDQVGTFAYRYFTNASGQTDSTLTKSSSNNSSLNFNTPFSILGFQISANVGAQSQENNFPITRTFVPDTGDTTQRITRTYARSYLQGVDWNVGFSLPSFLNNSFRVRPDIFFQNVAGGSYWIRSELSGGQFVHQSKRVSAGISLSPTLFALFPGIGPLERIRHSITPSFRFSYSPSATVNPEYLRALNQNPANFIGGLAQNQVSMSLSQVFEGKFREDTSKKGEGRKLRLLSVNMSPLVYDFERARKTHLTGLVTDHVSYDLASDLLPGFSLRSDYSLFQGSINSDTARFSPFRESVSAAFTISGESGIIGAIGRLFGRTPSPSAPTTQQLPVDTTGMAQSLTSFPAAGIYSQSRQYQIPDTRTWTASVTFSSSRQRPPRGGRVLAFDPTTYCNQFISNPAIFDQCKQNVLVNPPTTVPFTDPIAGGTFVSVPPRENIGLQSSFHITPNWLASWETVYDAVNNNFASQQVTLQRELHDWRAVFAFTSSPNGNFYFSFYIANKAQPELRFPYTRSTYRQPAVP